MILVILILIILTLIYLYVKHIYSYWKRHGFDFVPPTFPLGNISVKVLLEKLSIHENCTNIYYATDKPIIGIYLLFRPLLLVRDPEFIRYMMVSDFDHFLDRGYYYDEEREPMSAHIVALGGEKWRSMRNKLSPTLTSGKLRQMMPQFLKVCDRLSEYLQKSCVESGSRSSVMDVTEIFARYTTDVIVSVAFGIEIDSINNENEMFWKLGKRISRPNFKESFIFNLTFMAPGLMKLFKIRCFPYDVEQFMMEIVRQTIHHREMTGEKRMDFIQSMMQQQNDGERNHESISDGKNGEEIDKPLSIGEICAQAFVLFVAGFETTSIMMSFFAFEMAKNHDIQKRLQEEVDEVLKKYDGIITYENVNEMTYLAMCLKETLRMYPSIATFLKQCSKDFPIPGTNLTLKKGVNCVISLKSLHMDPKYFENPEKFDPDRFSAKNKGNIIPFSYVPFGEGARNCIGERLALIQSSVALVEIISKFEFHLAPGQSRTVKIQPNAAFYAAKGGISLEFRLRK